MAPTQDPIIIPGKKIPAGILTPYVTVVKKYQIAKKLIKVNMLGVRSVISALSCNPMMYVTVLLSVLKSIDPTGLTYPLGQFHWTKVMSLKPSGRESTSGVETH